jgi:hypothetical protein
MLDQFQQAFADLAASPALVSEIAHDPSLLRGRYELSDLEWRRLASVVNQPGMKCNCMLYRANRLTPLAEYLPQTSQLAAKNHAQLLSEYWTVYTNTNINFLVESYRFCQFVQKKADDGSFTDEAFLSVLQRERSQVCVQLKEMFCGNDADPGTPDLKDLTTVFTTSGMEIDLKAFLSYLN